MKSVTEGTSLNGEDMSIYQYYLVCYDVSDNKIRKKMYDYLKDIGLIPLQHSVFWGQLTKAEISSLKREAFTKLDIETDKMFWLPTSLDIESLKQGFGYKHFRYVEADGNFTL